LDFRILGPLEVADQGRELALTGGKQSALLAILLLHPNEVVPTDRLIDELWGERAPPTAAKSLQVHVSRLRATFDDSGSGPDGVVLTRGGGYLIRVAPGELDRDRFERLVQEASGALGEGEARRALELLGEAFALWRGPRWPTSPTRASPSRRSHGSRSSTWRRPRCASTRSSRLASTPG
jgi:DNA-binding SARP family transcriptional activator